MNIIDKFINRENKNTDKSGNRQIVNLTYFFAVVFLALIAYIVVFMIRDSEDVINNSYNKREKLYSEKVVRGSILASDGTVLAYTDSNGETEKRVYPYGPIFAHVIGYNTKGKAGLESTCTFKLLRSDILITERLENDIKGLKNPGNNIITTLDVSAQQAAYNALQNVKGAIVLMDADTGDILAMVSKPDFDPNTIDANWDSIMSNGENSILLNRATQGLYPPGSTFKIVTALEYINENADTDDYEFNCTGSFTYKGSTINCYHGIAHGDTDFDLSFAKSCNASFANITTTLNKSRFRKTCEGLLFNEEIPCPLYAEDSYVPIDSDSSIDELMQTGIGQGKTAITPYHMCLISSAIANDGLLMYPRIIKSVETSEGDPISETDVRQYKRLISVSDSVKLKVLMRKVITEGTGTKLQDTYGYKAYGKTGSAEFNSDKSRSHAWFTGFAETDSGKRVAISIIIEDGGSGGQVAVPIAKSVFDSYLYNYVN